MTSLSQPAEAGPDVAASTPKATLAVLGLVRAPRALVCGATRAPRNTPALLCHGVRTALGCHCRGQSHRRCMWVCVLGR